jgi:hypothetical protein
MKIMMSIRVGFCKVKEKAKGCIPGKMVANIEEASTKENSKEKAPSSTE